MNLADTQRAFWELATRGPAAAEHDAGRLFESTAELSAGDRISIYADMFLWRQVDALRDDFPKLAAALGDEPFFALAGDYLRAHPSDHHDLGKLGRHLPAFVAARADPPRPDLACLAALERARSEVFEEREVASAGVDLLSSLPAEEIPQTRLIVVPALRVLTLRHDPLSLWQSLEDQTAAPAPQPGRAHVAVWRKGLVVYHAGVVPAEAEAIRLAQLGATLEEICGAFVDQEDAARAAFAVIASWFAEEWIARPTGETE